MRFGQDIGVSILSYRSLALMVAWLSRGRARRLDQALKEAREIGQAATLMYALQHAPLTHILLRELRDSKRGIR